MQESDKRNFWTTINIMMENYNRPPLSKESIVVWYGALNKFDFTTIVNACDNWMNHQTKSPTMKDIADLCKPKEEFYKALPRPVPNEISKQQSEKIVEMVSNIKPVKDYKQWARNILANPKGLPDISIRFAKEALNAD